jgi:hypothetical protein
LLTCGRGEFGQEIRRSGDQEIRRSGDQKIRRSEDQKIRRHFLIGLVFEK